MLTVSPCPWRRSRRGVLARFCLLASFGIPASSALRLGRALLLGHALLAFSHDVTPGSEPDWTEWHDREHIPERLSIPGFLRLRRYVALGAGPLDDVEAMHSGARAGEATVVNQASRDSKAVSREEGLGRACRVAVNRASSASREATACGWATTPSIRRANRAWRAIRRRDSSSTTTRAYNR